MLGYQFKLKHGHTCEDHSCINILLGRDCQFIGTQLNHASTFVGFKKKPFEILLNPYLVLQGVFVEQKSVQCFGDFLFVAKE